MTRPFIELLRKHEQGYTATYSHLLLALVDATLVEVPFRHEALWGDQLRPGDQWHYHGEGPLEEARSWGEYEESTRTDPERLLDRIPRGTFVMHLLAGNDASALRVRNSYLEGRDPDRAPAASVGEQLRTAVTAFFTDEPLPEVAVHDPLVADCYALLHRALEGPTPAWVEATKLVRTRERWRLRLAERAPLRFVPLGPWAEHAGIAAKVLDVGASELSAEKAVECFVADDSIDGLAFPKGASTGPLARLALGEHAARLRVLLGAHPSPRFRHLAMVRSPYGLESLADMEPLQAVLGLESFGPQDFELLATAEAFRELRFLEARGPRSEDGAEQSWIRSERTRHMRVLAFHNLTAGDSTFGMDAQALTALAHADWSSLRVLDLRNFDHLEPEAVEAFVTNPRLGPLRHLSLEGSWADASSLEAIARCERLAALELLDMSRTRSEDGVGAIGESPHLRELRTLRLWMVTSEGVRRLAESGRFHQLAELAMPRSALREAVRELAGAEWLASVRVLQLEESDLDDDALLELMRSPYLQGIERVELFKNPITAKGVEAVLRLELPALRKLGVYGTKVRSQAHRMAIKGMRPKVEVHI